MSNIFFTSDTHFFHKNILKFCPDTRFGTDHVEMTELMVEDWNKRVQPGDVVYHLGDVSFGRTEESEKVLARLNGELHLIQGNHDGGVVQGPCRKRWASVQPYLRKKINGQDIVMFHYPIVEWDCMHHGSWHFYGHVHGKNMGLSDRKAMDVGVDSRGHVDMAPWSFEELKAIMDLRQVFSHHYKGNIK